MRLIGSAKLCGCPALYVLCLVLLSGLTGCGSQSNAASDSKAGGVNAQSGSSQPANASDADMRKSFSQKTFDINSVPAKDRERVRAIMEAQKNRTK